MKTLKCPNCGKEVNVDNLIMEYTGKYDIWYMEVIKLLCPHCKNDVRYGE